MEEKIVGKKVGRPKKDALERKSYYKTIRLDMEDYNKLYYLKGVLKKSEADVFRDAIRRTFNDEINK